MEDLMRDILIKAGFPDDIASLVGKRFVFKPDPSSLAAQALRAFDIDVFDIHGRIIGAEVTLYNDFTEYAWIVLTVDTGGLPRAEGDERRLSFANITHGFWNYTATPSSPALPGMLTILDD